MLYYVTKTAGLRLPVEWRKWALFLLLMKDDGYTGNAVVLTDPWYLKPIHKEGSGKYD